MRCVAFLLFLAPSLLFAETRVEAEVSGQLRGFAYRGLDGQRQWQPSLALSAEISHTLESGDQIVFSPFYRLDGLDGQRSHGDIRELYWTRVGDAWEFSLGAKQVFWGVTEFAHLVDVINQTDLVENIDDEDRLGQPMAHLSLVRDWGILDLYALLGFRERTFPGREGRLRPRPVIDEDRPLYASGAEDRRIDGAIRWSQQFGGLDLGVYHFSGTARDPEFVPAPEGRVRPLYHTIDQTGLDAQLLQGQWAFKLEALRRSGQAGSHHAAVGGFERTFVGVLDSDTDVGLVVEYLYDQRGEDATETIFENDVALGARFALNDISNTSALVGVIWDAETDERVLSVEAERQLGADWLLSVEGRAFSGASRQRRAFDPVDADARSGFLARDDYIQLELKRFF